jgi:hypothetical protein
MLFTTFRGVSPPTPPQMLSEGMASVAHDVNLQHGTLKPWRELKAVAQLPETTLTVESYGCCNFPFDACVSVARWLPDCPRLYITGRMPYPEIAAINWDTCSLDYARLGIPMPLTTPLVSYITVPDKSIETALRTYMFTYVNWLGEESAPSFPSSELAVNDGQAVTVSGWAAQPPEYRVEKVRIYRRATGFRTGTEKEQDVATDFLYLDEVGIGVGEVREPPANLRGITAVDGTAVLCGYVGNKLYFTKNHQPWNWPAELELTLDDNIVHIAQDDGELFASTTGKPYNIEGAPTCGDRPCRPVTSADYPFPDIGCGYAHAAIVTPFGMVYASTDGLILVSKTSPPTVLTEAVLAADDWAALRPDTARLAYYKGYIICVTAVVSFMLLIDTATYRTAAQVAAMSTLSDTPVDMVRSDSGELLFLSDTGMLSQWNAGETLRPYRWVSAPFIAGSQHWYPVGCVYVNGSTIYNIMGDNGKLFSRLVTTDKPFRTRRLSRNRRHSVEFTGVGEVSYFRIGETRIDEANRR